ncbi:MAG: TolC family protein [Candidatus Omnitrophica bacterium]|nr:TolC family protein [Candidatus Omnitrophota bacterium]
MHKTFSWLLILVNLALPLAAHAAEVSLTLDEAITIALRDNPDVLLKAEDLKKAKAQIAEATASLYPSLSVSGSWTDTRGLYAEDVDAYSGHIGAKQLLYKGGQVMAAIKIGEYNYKATEAALDAARQYTVYATKSAFYALMLAEKYAVLNKDIVANTAAHQAVIEARFKSGEASESDRIRMRASLADTSQAYEASRNQVQAAQALLNNLLSFEKDVVIRPAGGFSYEARDVALDEAFLKALKERPEIRQLDAQLEMARQNIEVARANARPNVYASWDYYASSRLAASTTRNNNDYNIIGITVSWPVFDGWLTKAKVDQALIGVKSTQLTRDKTAKAVALDVRTAYLELATALAKTRSVAEETRVYEDNFVVIRQQYNAGIASALDTEDAQLGLTVAQFNKIIADYDYLIAQARFDRATGGT